MFSIGICIDKNTFFVQMEEEKYFFCVQFSPVNTGNGSPVTRHFPIGT